MLVESRHITVLEMALHVWEWRTWPSVLTCLAFNCSQFGRRDCDRAQSAAMRLDSSSPRLYKLYQRWKRTVGFVPYGRRQQLFLIRTWNLEGVMFTLAAHISDTRRSYLLKTNKKKKSWETGSKGKRSSTLAFLEVAWDIAKEIPSDITRFYDRELPYETVHAWCSPV